MKYVKIGGSYKKVCGNCYSSAGSPGQLPNVIAIRERQKADRKRREVSYKERRRRYKLDIGGKKYKAGKKHPENPNQQALF